MLRRVRVHFIALFMGVAVLSSCDLLNDLLAGAGNLSIPVLSNGDISKGLKEALKVGTDTAVNRLARNNGFYGDKLVQIGLPKEADMIVKNLSKVPLIGAPLVEEAKKLINRAAEDAAKEAGPIFKSAITTMSIADAVNILKGNDTAATHYLRGKTYRQLKQAFLPKIKSSLSKDLVKSTSAEEAYQKLIDNYNLAAKIPFSGLEPIKTNSLSEYATDRALNGLFSKVANEEKDIRTDPLARVSDILKKVFDENAAVGI